MPTLIADTEHIEDALGGALSAADLRLLARMQAGIEAQIKRHCNWDILQQTRIEYHPHRNEAQYVHPMLANDANYHPNAAAIRQGLDCIQLDQGFVRSITSIKINTATTGLDSDFDAITAELSTSYRLNVDEHNSTDDTVLCRDGMVIRLGSAWPTQAGSVRIQYVNGFTADELEASYPDIHMAIVDEVAQRFRVTQHLRTSEGLYPITSKKTQDYSVSYDTKAGIDSMTMSTSRGSLSKDLMDALQPLVYYGQVF